MRYAMFAADLVKYFFRSASPPEGHATKPLTDASLCPDTGRNIEQALIGFGILDNSRSFPFHRQNHGALTLLELFHEVAGTSAESSQRLNVLSDVQHRPAPFDSTLLGAISILVPSRTEKAFWGAFAHDRTLEISAGQECVSRQELSHCA